MSTVNDVRILQHTVNLCQRASQEVPFSVEVVTCFFNDAVGDSNGGIIIIKMKRNRSLNTTNGLLAKMESSYVTTCFGLLLWPSSGYNLVALTVCTMCLTLRRLMSYIYMEHPFLMFLDHTQRRTTVGRTPLDE